MASGACELLARCQRVDESRDDRCLRRCGLGEPGCHGADRADGKRDSDPRGSLARLSARKHWRRRAQRGSAFGDPLEIQQQIVRALHALVGILREARADDAIERGVHQRLRGRDRRRVLLQNRAEETRLALADERAPAREHLVEDAAKRPDVRARVGLFALHHLRRHVLIRSENRPLHCQRRRHRRGRRHQRGGGRAGGRSAGHDLREAEVEELDPGRREHHVAGFQVAVEDALAVRRVQRARDLNGPRQRLLDRNRSLRDTRRQRLALEVLHDEKRRLILLADVEERADVAVTQLGDGTRLALEALAQFRCGGDVGRQRLDGDDAIEACVCGLVDLAHPPRADGAEDLVRAEARAGGEGHGWTPIVAAAIPNTKGNRRGPVAAALSLAHVVVPTDRFLRVA